MVEDDHSYFVGSANGGLWVHNPNACTTAARRSYSGSGYEGRIERVSGKPNGYPGEHRPLDVFGKDGDQWNFHDVHVNAEGIVHDPMSREIGKTPSTKLRYDEWRSYYDNPEYIFRDVTSKLYPK